MQPTADILQELGRRRRPGQVLVGFAAEHGEGAVERARSKLERKRVDMIVMNDISRSDIGFDSDDNEILIVTSHEETGVSRRSKQQVAGGNLGRDRCRTHVSLKHQPDQRSKGRLHVEAHQVQDSDTAQAISAAGDTARSVIENVARVIHAPEGCSSGACSRCSARGTSSSRTFPAWARRCSPSRSPARWTASSPASRPRPTCSRRTSPGSTSTTSRPTSSSSGPGPVFSNLVLVDEINRASPKTQSALLECMQEVQVTVDGSTHPLSRPFMVIATQNPIEYEGTFPLPEAQLDRFAMRLHLGYPSLAEESRMLSEHAATEPIEELEPVIGAAELRPRSRRSSGSTSRTACIATWLRSFATPGPTPGWRWAPARGRASRCCASPRRSPPFAGASTRYRPTSRRSPADVLAHRVILAADARSGGLDPGDDLWNSQHCFNQVPKPVALLRSTGSKPTAFA